MRTEMEVEMDDCLDEKHETACIGSRLYDTFLLEYRHLALIVETSMAFVK